MNHLAKKLLCFAAGSIFATSLATAADGTWTNTTGGNWSDIANWNNGLGPIADASGFTANFSTLDLAADTTVHLDGVRTLTSLTFGDTDSGAVTAAGWILDNNGNAANILTLAGTTPGITVGALGTGKNVTIGAVVAGTAGLSKAGAGTLVLTGANTYSGNTAITAGTLQIGDGTATGTLGNGSYAGNITLSSGTNFIYNSNTTQTLTGVVGGSGSTFTVSNGTVKFSGNDRWTAGTTLTIGTGATFDYTPANTHRFSNGAMNITGAGTFKSSGTGTSYMANGTAYQAVNMSAGGKLWVSSGTASDYNVKTTNLGDLQLDGTLQQPLGNDAYFNALNGSSTGQFVFSSTGNGFGLRVGVNNGGGTFAGVIRDWNASTAVAAFTKVGTGTQILSGANTYRGATNVQNGVLQLGGADNRLAATTVLTLGNATTSGKLVLGSTGVSGVTDAKSDLTVAGLQTSGTGTANAIVGGHSAVSTLTVNLASGTNTFAGALGGAGANENNLALIKSGAGTLTLSGANTHIGGTTISAGTLVTGNTSALGAGAVTLSGGTLQVGDGTVNTVVGVGAITLNSGTLKFLAANSAITQAGSAGFQLTNGVILDLNNAFNAAGTYTLISSAGASNGIGNYTLSGADTANYNFNFALSGANGLLTVTAVPEPSTYGLLGAGALALVAAVRRRKRMN